MKYRRNLGDHYTPLYFLNALAAGGLAVSFFMFLSLLTLRNGLSAVTFFTLYDAAINTGPGFSLLALVGCLGTAFFSYEFVQLLLWNHRHLKVWEKTESASSLKNSAGAHHLMAIPLTIAFSLNLVVAYASAFIPYAWRLREWLFPVLFVAFVWAALRAFKPYFADMSVATAATPKDSLGRVLTSATFSLLGYGFSTLAMFSGIKLTVLIGYLSASFCLIAAVFVLFAGLLAALKERPSSEETGRLWLALPALTLFGLCCYRLRGSLAANFYADQVPAMNFTFFSALFLVQVFLGLVLWASTKHDINYRQTQTGKEAILRSYILVGTGSALVVLGHYLINDGLVRIDLFTGHSIGYWFAYLPFVALQLVSLRLFLKTNKQLFSPQVKRQTPAQQQPQTHQDAS